MILALNNHRLLVMEIEEFSEGKDNVVNNVNCNDGSQKPTFLKSLWELLKSIGKIAQLNNSLRVAHKKVVYSIKKDSKLLTTLTDIRDKEDVYIKWERLSRQLNKHKSKRPERTTFLTKGVATKSFKIIDLVNNFVENLKAELYPPKKPLSLAQQKKYVEKFKHLPQDVLEDLAAD